MRTIRKFEFIFPDESIDKILERFSFSVSKDFKKLKIDIEDLKNILLENHSEDNTNLTGSLIYGSDEIGIRKIRLSKGKGKGKREGYRLIALVLNVKGKAYVLHIYDKKKKTILSDGDKDNLKLLLKSFPK